MFHPLRIRKEWSALETNADHRRAGRCGRNSVPGASVKRRSMMPAGRHASVGCVLIGVWIDEYNHRSRQVNHVFRRIGPGDERMDSWYQRADFERGFEIFHVAISNKVVAIIKTDLSDWRCGISLYLNRDFLVRIENGKWAFVPLRPRRSDSQ